MNTIITHSVLGLLMMAAGFSAAIADPVSINFCDVA
jgi:hypothetical protein